MARSTAKQVRVLFAESSEENDSVHISFQDFGGKATNVRFPAIQLGALIENLQRVRETLEEGDKHTGRGLTLIPGVNSDWWDEHKPISLLCSCGEGDCEPGYIMCPECIARDDED